MFAVSVNQDNNYLDVQQKIYFSIIFWQSYVFYIYNQSVKINLDLASGASDDWAMQVAKVPLVYTMELPDYGEGFITPIEKIKPMVRETYEAFEIFVKYICAFHHVHCI